MTTPARRRRCSSVSRTERTARATANCLLILPHTDVNEKCPPPPLRRSIHPRRGILSAEGGLIEGKSIGHMVKWAGFERRINYAIDLAGASDRNLHGLPDL